MIRRTAIVAFAGLFLCAAAWAQAQTLISTTTTFDGGQGNLTGSLTVDGSPTPTLFLQNGTTMTAGSTILTIGSSQPGAHHLSGGSTLTNSAFCSVGFNSRATE